MNKVILMGRLTRDPEVRYTQGDNSLCIANFTVAVDRRMGRNNQDGGPTADFIPCVVFGKQAEHVEKYYRKGLKTCLSGRIQTRNYTNREGVKVYVTEVVVEDLEFAESKSASQAGSGNYGGGYSGNNSNYGGGNRVIMAVETTVETTAITAVETMAETAEATALPTAVTALPPRDRIRIPLPHLTLWMDL